MSNAREKPKLLYILRQDLWSESSSPVNCLLFWQDLLFVGCSSGRVLSYDLQTLRTRTSVFPDLRESCLQLLHIGDQMLTQSKGGEINLWTRPESDTWTRCSSLNLKHIGFCRMRHLEGTGLRDSVAVPVDQSELSIVSAYGGSLQEVLRFSLPEKLQSGAGHMTALCSVGSDLVMTVYESAVLHLWDVRYPSAPCCSLHIEYDSSSADGIPTPFAIEFDGETKRGIMGGMGAQLSTFSVDSSGSLSHCKTRHSMAVRDGSSLSICLQPRSAASTRSRPLAVGCRDGRLRIFSWPSGRALASPRAVPTAPTTAVQEVAFSPGPLPSLRSSGIVAAGCADGSVSLWDADFSTGV